MMTPYRLHILLLLILSLQVHAEVWIITDKQHPLKNIPADAHQIFLDEPELLQKNSMQVYPIIHKQQR